MSAWTTTYINVDVEIDAKKVEDYFNRGSTDVSKFRAIIDDCRRSRNSYFENSKGEV
jgi:hypothetical protein